MKLRKLDNKDAVLMLEWMHDDSVVHDLRTDFASKTIDDCNEFIKVAQNTNESLHLAITNDNDEYMGTVSLKHFKDNSAEFGITIRKCAMGKGYSRWAMGEIIKIGFEQYKLKSIYWCVDPFNQRALHFYDKNDYNRCIAPIQANDYSLDEKERYVWYKVDCKQD